MSGLNLSKFFDKYPDADWLEDSPSGIRSRYTNGLGEGTEHESVWFCVLCDEEYTGDGFDPCDHCNDEA